MKAFPELSVTVDKIGGGAGHLPTARIKFHGKWMPLHRYVWELYNGPIPEGHDVHHGKMGRLCNCISNLECLGHGEHRSRHTGWHHDAASKKKQSVWQKGIPHKPETIEKFKKTWASFTEEKKAEMKKKQLARPHEDRSAAAKRAWETRRRNKGDQ